MESLPRARIGGGGGGLHHHQQQHFASARSSSASIAPSVSGSAGPSSSSSSSSSLASSSRRRASCGKMEMMTTAIASGAVAFRNTGAFALAGKDERHEGVSLWGEGCEVNVFQPHRKALAAPPSAAGSSASAVALGLSEKQVVYQNPDHCATSFPTFEHIRRQGKLCDVTLKVSACRPLRLCADVIICASRA